MAKDRDKDKDDKRRGKKGGTGKGRGGGRKPGREIRRLAKGMLGKPPKALRPTKTKKLTKEATKTMAAIYAPAYAELESQQKTLKSVDAKRTRDNRYYLSWLDSQSKQLQAHSRAADDKILSTQKEIADTANAATAGMRDKLIEQAGEQSQVVSNAKQASAFETSPEAKRSAEMIEGERQRTAGSVESAEKSRQVNQASNFAQQAAAEARRVSDLWTGMKDIASAKQKVKLEQAAETSKEVARLLDREIEKAQARSEMKLSGLELALQQRRLNLDKWIAKQQIDAEAKESRKERRFERKESKKERKHESKEAAKDRKADKEDGGDGDGKGKNKAKAANKAARQIVNQLGLDKAKNNKAQVIDKVMSQTGVGYNQALKAVNKAINQAKGGGGGGGNNGTAGSPNADLND